MNLIIKIVYKDILRKFYIIIIIKKKTNFQEMNMKKIKKNKKFDNKNKNKNNFNNNKINKKSLG